VSRDEDVPAARPARRGLVAAALFLTCAGAPTAAQTIADRGFVDATATAFPQEAPNDSTRLVGDLLVRGEAFVKPQPWIQFAGGIDVRANSHEQVDQRWRLDLDDRTVKRPALSLRRLTATVTHGPVTVDVGKQFIRWGKTDIVTPTDRFAPRDFLNVVENDFLAVLGVRGVAQIRDDTIELVWVPRFTPSRTPLVDQRWTVVENLPSGVSIVDRGSLLPTATEQGVRWRHTGATVEYSLSFFDGSNYLPDIAVEARLPSAAAAQAMVELDVTRVYPPLRTYGGDIAIPTKLFTVKGEAAYFTSTSPTTDEYVLYVVQLERQTGEWVFVGGYAGDVVTEHRAAFTFAPDRGLTRSIIGRGSYTIDANRSVAFEAAFRQNGGGQYAKGEYSHARGEHWRATATGIAIAGRSGDFIGQYRRNSNVTLSLRYSF